MGCQFVGENPRGLLTSPSSHVTFLLLNGLIVWSDSMQNLELKLGKNMNSPYVPTLARMWFNWYKRNMTVYVQQEKTICNAWKVRSICRTSPPSILFVSEIFAFQYFRGFELKLLVWQEYYFHMIKYIAASSPLLWKQLNSFSFSPFLMNA